VPPGVSSGSEPGNEAVARMSPLPAREAPLLSRPARFSFAATVTGVKQRIGHADGRVEESALGAI
jgi:hypothetical protein